MSPRIAILPSPLLGPASYEPLAAALAERGAETVVAALPAGRVTPPGVLDQFRAILEQHGATVLVPHSNAGYLAPAVAAERGVATVFMDAALPAGAVTETLLAPPVFADFIGTLPHTDGLLPPWPLWWKQADIADLFPDEEWLDRVTREAPRLAPSYFTTPVPVPRGWEARPAAYLAFGDTYAAELAFAERSGWVVRRDSGHHLAHLADPGRVAGLLLELCSDLSSGPTKTTGTTGGRGHTVEP